MLEINYNIDAKIFVTMKATNLQLHKLLIDLGLSENEASIYLAALKIGNCRITELAFHAELKRTTAYSLIASLKSKGLINEHIKGFKRTYSASPPEMLEVLHANKLSLLRQSLPLFQTLRSEEKEVKSVVYLEGKEAVKSIYEDLLKNSKENDFYYAVSDVEKWRNMDPVYCDEFIKRRVKKKLDLKFLFTRTAEAEKRKAIAKKLAEHVKFLPPNYNLNTNLVITPKRIVIHQTGSPTLAVSMDNKAFIEIHRVMFELLWESIK